ncbi:translation initiation factor IF-3, mitochondrial [Salarias fasciatus]|uniref:Translation initiation factor 3 N-terminal domain-containing protein n=1 Tax=Salarias fasciatus TaxID=181472 RepID=A0A672IZH7_SALFA|nr:translation initiation factor IF-3, mitochondrial [Salarias fasciatus]XP_029966532.1 translation initiation factor IF-3, mitochondrial [Salarias fasciatus]XP_029966533.1 translation initiation factor IF-3, mitochondrial [Salarias fasciatus]
MSAGCVRWMLSQAVRSVCGVNLVYRASASRFRICMERQNIAAASWRWSNFSTEVSDTEHTPEPKKKKAALRTNVPIGSVGRKIPHRQIQVISEDGEDLGTLHRADVVRIMDEKGLKLVLLHEKKDPPVYQLMSGKQIHEEQLKQREKKKAKAAQVQVKELTFSAGIASHDLATKLKQAESWLEKKHHVRITLRSAHGDANASPVTALEQMVEQMEVMLGFISKPQAIRDGRAAMCILRPPSAKELQQMKQAGKPPSADATASQSKTSSVSSTDTTEQSPQP